MTSVGENGADRGERHRTGGETEAARSLQVGHHYLNCQRKVGASLSLSLWHDNRIFTQRAEQFWKQMPRDETIPFC